VTVKFASDVILSAMTRLGLLGGTFDPVHHGHLRAAVEVKSYLGADELRLVPSHTPPHRDPTGGSSEDRLAMLRIAIGDNAGLEIDDREVRRGGRSYTVDTLRSIRDSGEANSIILVLGMDSFLTLPEWFKWREVRSLAHIAVLTRPGAEEPLPPALAEWTRGRWVDDTDLLGDVTHGNFLRFTPTQMAVSATAIRQHVRRGESIEYLTPPGVIRYIESKGLYAVETSHGQHAGAEPIANAK
jgi:nicotinate-nucleotide adenylyltransferase